MTDALKRHWPEYLMEGTCLGLFMVSAFTFATILEHPASPIHQVIPNPLLRRFFMGIAMGLTAIGIIYSPWGKQSGAHINPSTTLTFFRLGKVAKWDALFYVVSQFAGGVAGALLAATVLSAWVSHPSVNYVVTAPGDLGANSAFLAEITIAFILMTVILTVSNNPRIHRFTGLCAGILVAVYITVEAPISGMSMNPARTFASAVSGNHWTALWVYFTAPLIGMISAAEVYVRMKGHRGPACAKLHHQNTKRCIFCGKPATQTQVTHQRGGESMDSKKFSLPGCLALLIFLSGCAALQVGQDVQAGRNALQTGRPEVALGYLRRATELDPNYTLPYTLRESVLTYLGRAYYETGNFAEARSTLEKALARDKADHLARLYLGLTLMRGGDPDRGRREAESGLKGIHDWLEDISATSSSGIFWDPGRQIRTDIEKTLAAKLEASEFIAAAQRIGREFDEEVDKARKDEASTRYGRTGGGGD